MRIVSKIHDYYDAATKFAPSDKSTTFVRATSEIPIVGEAGDKLEIPSEIDGKFRDKDKGSFCISFGFVGFCGKIYPYIHMRRTIPMESAILVQVAYSNKEEYFYSFDGFCKKYSEISEGKALAGYMDKMVYSSQGNIESIRLWLEEGAKRVYQAELRKKVSVCIKEEKVLLDFFLAHRVAYFKHTGKRHNTKNDVLIEAYPVLKDCQFYKVFDVYAAFQEVEMFLTNQIVKPDDPYIAPVPDKIKVESHGFNEFSFRQDPSSKKKRIKK